MAAKSAKLIEKAELGLLDRACRTGSAQDIEDAIVWYKLKTGTEARVANAQEAEAAVAADYASFTDVLTRGIPAYLIAGLYPVLLGEEGMLGPPEGRRYCWNLGPKTPRYTAVLKQSFDEFYEWDRLLERLWHDITEFYTEDYDVLTEDELSEDEQERNHDIVAVMDADIGQDVTAMNDAINMDADIALAVKEYFDAKRFISYLVWQTYHRMEVTDIMWCGMNSKSYARSNRTRIETVLMPFLEAKLEREHELFARLDGKYVGLPQKPFKGERVMFTSLWAQLQQVLSPDSD